MKKDYKFCPNCKNELSKEEEKIFCKNCNFIDYLDPSSTASVIPVKDDKILISIRGNKPFKGSIDLIGGFCKANESMEKAAIRETMEETGLKVKIKKYLGSYPDTYGENGKSVLGVVFIVEIISGDPKANDDVSDLHWVQIKDIPNLDFNGFKNTKEALMDFYKNRESSQLQDLIK